MRSYHTHTFPLYSSLSLHFSIQLSLHFLEGVGEAGCGPGVEREVVESFSKGLVISDSSVSVSEESSGDARGGVADVVVVEGHARSGYRSYTGYGQPLDLTGGTYSSTPRSSSSSGGKFSCSLFKPLDSAHSNKCMYVPVPITYQPSPQQGCTQRVVQRGAQEGKGKGGTIPVQHPRHCESLKNAFRAFGHLVGHFVLRKISSAADGWQGGGEGERVCCLLTLSILIIISMITIIIHSEHSYYFCFCSQYFSS